MVRGCEKRVVRLQEAGSCFEEVLFILRDGQASASECDIVAEADRIIRENNKERRKGYALPSYLCFLLGAAAAAAVLLPLFLLW